MVSLLVTCVALFYGYFLPSFVAASSCSSALPIWLPLGNCTITQPGIPDIISWGALIGVGNSSQQVCAVPSTVVNSTLIMSSEVCANATAQNETDAQCRSRRGNYVDRSSLTVTSLDSLPPDPGWSAIMAPLPAFQYAVNALLQLRSDDSVDMPEGLVSEGENHTTSHLGLGVNSELLGQLVNVGIIPARSWGLNPGSQSITSPSDGNLVLGGYDEASVKGSFVDYDMNYPVAIGSEGRDCPLQVTVEKLILRPAGGQDISLSDASSPFQSCIEPYDNLLRLPTGAHDLFLQHTGLSAQGPSDPSILDLEPGITFFNHNSTFGFNASLIVTLNNGFQVEIPNYELQHQLRGLAANGSRVLNSSITEVQVFSDPVPLGSAVLGKVFLSQVYLAVNYDQKIFKLAHLNPDAVIPVPVTFQQCPSNLSATSIGLIVVGIVLALLLALLVLLALRKWRHRFTTAKTLEDKSDTPQPAPIEHTATNGAPPPPLPFHHDRSPSPINTPPPPGAPYELSSNRRVSEVAGSMALTPATTNAAMPSSDGQRSPLTPLTTHERPAADFPGFDGQRSPGLVELENSLERDAKANA